MGILPKARPRIAEHEARELAMRVVRETGYGKPLPKVFVVAVRGYYRDTMGKPGVNDRGLYDDAFIVITPTLYATFNGNVDPSIYRKATSKRKGVASIKAPQVLWYKPGIHYGKIPHKAFRQNAPCWVHRDGGAIEYGMFGVNNHRGGISGTSSLGCLTLPPVQWPLYYSTVTKSLEQYGQETFPILLIDTTGDA